MGSFPLPVVLVRCSAIRDWIPQQPARHTLRRFAWRVGYEPSPPQARLRRTPAGALASPASAGYHTTGSQCAGGSAAVLMRECVWDSSFARLRQKPAAVSGADPRNGHSTCTGFWSHARRPVCAFAISTPRAPARAPSPAASVTTPSHPRKGHSQPPRERGGESPYSAPGKLKFRN